MALQVYSKNNQFDKNNYFQDLILKAQGNIYDLPSIINIEISKINDRVHENIMKGIDKVNKSQDGAKIFRKIKGKLKRHEIEEQLLFLTVHQNALSKKDFEAKMKLIRDNKHLFEEYYDQDDLLKEKLGLIQHLKSVTNYHERINVEDSAAVQKEAKSFIKRIVKEKEEREKKKQSFQKQQEDRQQREQQEIERKKEEERQKMEEDYKLKKQEIIHKMKEKEEQRKKFRDDTAVAVKQVMRAQPLYMVIEQKYKEEVELPELDQQKEKLKKLRNFYKPIQELDIDRHQRNYDIQKRQMETDIKRQRELTTRSMKDHIAGLKYKPHLTDFKDEQRQKMVEEEERLREEKRKIQEKIGNYAKYVKEMYWPKVSDTKRQELQVLKNSILTQPRKRSYSAKKKLVPSLNDDHEYMIESSHNGLSNVHSLPQLSSIGGYTPQQIQSKKKLNWEGKKKRQESEVYERRNQVEMIKSVDYLKDQRFKRDLDGKRPKIIDDKIMDKYLNDQNMTEHQRLEEIRRRAYIMEQRAQMDEKLIRNSIKGGDPQLSVEKTIAVNDMYLDAIQAKLKILDQI